MSGLTEYLLDDEFTHVEDSTQVWVCPFCRAHHSSLMGATKDDIEWLHFETTPVCKQKHQAELAFERERSEREKRDYLCNLCEAQIYGYSAFMVHKSGHSIQNAKREKEPKIDLTAEKVSVYLLAKPDASDTEIGLALNIPRTTVSDARRRLRRNIA